MGQGIITMSQKELQRLPVMEAVCAKKMAQTEAAESLGLSARHVRRLQRRLQTEGPSGLKHRSRGRASNRRYAEKFKEHVLKLIRETYPDFGPTLACEKLKGRGIFLSEETLRVWMRAAGLQNGRRRQRPHRQWRERSACSGQMVQLDGSHHDWLEGRGPRLVLMGYIDDATGKSYGRFYPSEDLAAALDSFKRYSQLYGVPQSVYVDKHTIYRSPGPVSVQNQLAGTVLQSQFERALSELGVRVIHANSPQAKGRVERLFKTLQDRLVKELRLNGIATLDQANRFLPGYWMQFNRRFARTARQQGNLHRCASGMRLQEILCVKESRRVANDGTIRIHGQQLQLFPATLRRLAGRMVTVTISPTGRIGVLDRDGALAYRVLPLQQRKPAPELLPVLQLPRALRWNPRSRPVRGHPWRKKLLARVKTLNSTQDLKALESLKT